MHFVVFVSVCLFVSFSTLSSSYSSMSSPIVDVDVVVVVVVIVIILLVNCIRRRSTEAVKEHFSKANWLCDQPHCVRVETCMTIYEYNVSIVFIHFPLYINELSLVAVQRLQLEKLSIQMGINSIRISK